MNETTIVLQIGTIFAVVAAIVAGALFMGRLSEKVDHTAKRVDELGSDMKVFLRAKWEEHPK